MKRVISALLILSFVLSTSTTVLAVENVEPQYGYINVEYSDSYGTAERLSTMNYNGMNYVIGSGIRFRTIMNMQLSVIWNMGIYQ